VSWDSDALRTPATAYAQTLAAILTWTMRITFDKIRNLHFALLILLLCHFGLTVLVGFGLNSSLTMALKVILYLTGIVLFFVSLRPFKKIALYYMFYSMTPVILILFYFVHGIFFGLLSSFALTPIVPLKSDYDRDDIKIYSKFNGFLGPCCEYYATERSFYLFERFKGTIYTEEVIDFETAEVTLRKDSILISAKNTYKVGVD
jgi:hypothetical protein